MHCSSRFASFAKAPVRKVAIGCRLSRDKVSDDHWLIFILTNELAALILP